MEQIEILTIILSIIVGLLIVYHIIRYVARIYEDIKTYKMIHKDRFVSVNIELANSIYLKKEEKYNLRRDETFLKKSTQSFLIKSLCNMVKDVIDRSSNPEFLVCVFERNKDTITICKYKDNQAIYNQAIIIGRVYTIDEYNESVSNEMLGNKVFKVINSATINKN